MTPINEALLKQKLILESQGYTVAFIALYGSQNYGLDIYTEDYRSDIDMKAIIVPTLDELVRNSKPVSEVVDTEWGQCDIKDIRSYFETLLKANPAYIETLFTKYYIVDNSFKDEFSIIFSKRDELVETLSAQFIKALYGMICEKKKALCHPYPSIAHKIEKYGYDGKQSSHILRLKTIIEGYFIEDKLFDECLYPPTEDVPMIMSMKLNEPSLEETKELVNEWMKDASIIKDRVLDEIDVIPIDDSIKDTFLSLSQNIIKYKIKEECRGVVV